MENSFFILSRLGFILKGFCSPLNIFYVIIIFVFSALAMAPWLLGQGSAWAHFCLPEPLLGRTGAREGFGSILERPRALKYDK